MRLSSKNILFIKPANSSFIKADQQILEKNFNVKPYLLVQNAGKLKYFFHLLKLSYFIFRNIKNVDLLVTWFGDYHSFVMVFIGNIFNKPTVIFAGGQEAICYKELGKGVYQKKIRGFCVKYALRNTSLILPNHKSLMYHENTFYNPDNPHIDGIHYYVPNIKAQVEVIPNGIDPNRIKFDLLIKKQANLILTVGTMNKKADFYNKGFDLFIEVSRLNPQLNFVLISLPRKYNGWVEEKYRVSEIKNLTIIPAFCPDDILSEYYNKAKVYLQISITEGMPVSLSEAMLCCCVPVGSNVNGIPDAVGEHGVVIYKRTVEELDLAIKKALTMNSGKDAREYTLKNYSFEIREQKLIKAIKAFI